MDGNAGGPSTNLRLPGSQIANLNDNQSPAGASGRPVKTGEDAIAEVCQIRHNEYGDERWCRTERPEAGLLGGVEQEGFEEVPEGRPADGRAGVVRRPDGGKAPRRQAAQGLWRGR